MTGGQNHFLVICDSITRRDGCFRDFLSTLSSLGLQPVFASPTLDEVSSDIPYPFIIAVDTGIEQTKEDLKNRLIKKGCVTALILVRPSISCIGYSDSTLDELAAAGVSVLATVGDEKHIAERILGALLLHCRRLHDVALLAKQGKIEEAKSTKAVELANKVVGVMGYGRLGRAVSLICEAFTCQTIVNDDLAEREYAMVSDGDMYEYGAVPLPAGDGDMELSERRGGEGSSMRRVESGSTIQAASAASSRRFSLWRSSNLSMVNARNSAFRTADQVVPKGQAIIYCPTMRDELRPGSFHCMSSMDLASGVPLTDDLGAPLSTCQATSVVLDFMSPPRINAAELRNAFQMGKIVRVFLQSTAEPDFEELKKEFPSKVGFMKPFTFNTMSDNAKRSLLADALDKALAALMRKEYGKAFGRTGRRTSATAEYFARAADVNTNAVRSFLHVLNDPTYPLSGNRNVMNWTRLCYCLSRMLLSFHNESHPLEIQVKFCGKLPFPDSDMQSTSPVRDYRVHLLCELCGAAAALPLAEVMKGDKKAVGFVNSVQVVTKDGVRVKTLYDPSSDSYHNYVEVRFFRDVKNDGSRQISQYCRGTVFGQDEIKVFDVDGHPIDTRPVGKMILYESECGSNIETTSLLVKVSALLEKYNINIADFSMGQSSIKNTTLAALHVDDYVQSEVIKSIQSLPEVTVARVLRV
mmetsp:Transcript_1517/g.3030  ORF Transcript_1517/g.3030 Transcript_1517/m.3030 type:complete len:696 (-) Transcript_1517:403-2490(-)